MKQIINKEFILDWVNRHKNEKRRFLNLGNGFWFVIRQGSVNIEVCENGTPISSPYTTVVCFKVENMPNDILKYANK